MNQTSLLAELAEILELPPAGLSPETPLATLPQWDSTAVIGFMALCDERYDRLVAADRVLACRTLGDLMELTGDESLSAG